jgi:hypothetical protein
MGLLLGFSVAYCILLFWHSLFLCSDCGFFVHGAFPLFWHTRYHAFLRLWIYWLLQMGSCCLKNGECPDTLVLVVSLCFEVNLIGLECLGYALSLVHFFGWFHVNYDLLVDKSGAQVNIALVYAVGSLCSGYDSLNVTRRMVFIPNSTVISSCSCSNISLSLLTPSSFQRTYKFCLCVRFEVTSTALCLRLTHG